MFASNEDIQVWLKEGMITVNDALAAKPNIEAQRTIKGQLSGVFSALTISSWADPTTTPELIRSVAGRLAAAFLYRNLAESESDEVSPYAQELYNEAIIVLGQIRTGEITVTDSSNDPIDSTGVNLLSFYPDNTVAPKFTMDQEFA